MPVYGHDVGMVGSPETKHGSVMHFVGHMASVHPDSQFAEQESKGEGEPSAVLLDQLRQ